MDAIFDSPWGDKNVSNAFAVSESKEVRDETIFEWGGYYGALFSIGGVKAYTVEEKNIR